MENFNQKCEIFDVDLCDKLGFLFWKINNSWKRNCKKIFEENNIDLTHGQLFLLHNILFTERDSEEITQIMLSEKTGIDPMSTSTLLRTLQKKGLIKRIENKKDSRSKLISTTEFGREIAEKAIGIIRNYNKDFFKDLKKEEKLSLKNLIILTLKNELKPDEKIFLN